MRNVRPRTGMANSRRALMAGFCRPMKEALLPGPRVLFMGGDGQAPRVQGSTPLIPEQSSGPEATATVPSTLTRRWVLWRLLSANNRELGRSQILHIDHSLCLQDLLRLKSALDRVEPMIIHANGRAEWTWTLLLDGAPVARSSRAYGRLRECHYSLEQFLAALPEAPVIDDPDLMVKQRRAHAIPGAFPVLPLADAL